MAAERTDKRTDEGTQDHQENQPSHNPFVLVLTHFPRQSVLFPLEL